MIYERKRIRGKTLAVVITLDKSSNVWPLVENFKMGMLIRFFGGPGTSSILNIKFTRQSRPHIT